MWLLESDEAFEGRRFWLRPGKTYLFGRTAAEPGQLAISHNTISRKHLTIKVDRVEAGDAHNATSRSGVVIEDLATKIGTVVNGQRIRGCKYVVSGEEAEMAMGKCPSIFRLIWVPVVFTFSFTSKELQAQPMRHLAERFEQLDIKLLVDYDTRSTSHVISKKRNTAKGLQALINGKHIVTETFLDAVAAAAEVDENDAEGSPLERDFGKFWPNALDHLPPRGSEPVQHADEIYAPDAGRRSVFEGYTFIFYDQTQFSNLLAPITDGCGKAVLRAVTAGETTVDEFVGYVKQVAGEEGVGRFDGDGEGRGVVLVRYLPAKRELIDWYTEFLTNVSLRLDHRPIEQNEFLDAILIKNASKLRRPLEVESSAPPPQRRSNSEAPAVQEPAEKPQPAPPPRRGARKPVKKRFAGFDDDDVDMDDIPPAPPQEAQPQNEEGLFVSQDPDADVMVQRKRTAEPEDDLMEGMAPAMAKFKRQRLDEAFAVTPAEPEPAPRQVSEKTKTQKKAKDGLDVLAVAAKHREEAEARARAEREELANINIPGDIDLAEIRRLNIVEEMEVRRDRAAEGDGRWNAKWNGVKNFKKFRRRGEVVGRQPARVIVGLMEVKNKDFGVGDNYWLEEGPRTKASRQQDDGVQQFPKAIVSDSGEEEQQGEEEERSTTQAKRAPPDPVQPPAKRVRPTIQLEIEDSEDSDDELKFRFGKRR